MQWIALSSLLIKIQCRLVKEIVFKHGMPDQQSLNLSVAESRSGIGSLRVGEARPGSASSGIVIV